MTRAAAYIRVSTELQAEEDRDQVPEEYEEAGAELPF